MKVKLLVFGLFCWKALLSQQNYFNHRLNLGLSETGFGILSFNSNYVFAGAVRDSISGVQNLNLSLLDDVGNLITSKSYYKINGYQYFGGYGGLTRIGNNGFTIANSVTYQNGNANILLYKFDDFLDTIWVKEFGDSAFQSAWKSKCTRDRGFIITGQTCTYDSLGDVLLLKTDSNGILEWEKHFGGFSEEIGFDVETCFDGGYIICGKTVSFGPNTQNYFPNIYIIKTDSLGNTEWTKTIGNDYGDVMYSVIQSKDGNFVAAGHITKYDPYQVCCHGWQYPTAIKFDIQGQIIWTKYFGNAIINSYIYSVKEDNNYNLLFSGITTDTLVYMSRGIIIKTDSSGDISFLRSYTPPNSISESYFYAASFDDDNGYVAIGYMYPVLPDTGNQDIWIVKTDSLGCDTANCQSLINVPELHQELSFNVYPNPFYDDLTIECKSIIENGSVSVIIYNTLGEEVGYYKFPSPAMSWKITDLKLSSGMYAIKLLKDNRLLGSVIRVLKY